MNKLLNCLGAILFNTDSYQNYMWMFYAAFKTILTEKKSVCFKSKDTSGANNCDFIAPRWFLYCHKTRRKYLYGKHGSPQGKCIFILYHFFYFLLPQTRRKYLFDKHGLTSGKMQFCKSCCGLLLSFANCSKTTHKNKSKWELPPLHEKGKIV